MPGDLITERWGGAVDGSTPTTTNSSISGDNGNPTIENTDSVPDGAEGWLKAAQTTLSNVRWDRTTTHGVLYLGFTHLPSHLPNSGAHVIFNVQATTTIRAQIRMADNGGYTMRNGTSVTGSATPAIAAGVKRRLHWTQNWAAGTQRLEVWHGANLWGETPDHTINGVLTNATRNRFVMGTVAGPSTVTGSYHLFGRVDLSTTGFEPPLVLAIAGKVLVSGIEKTIAARHVVVNGVKKTVVNAWVVVNGVKRPLV